MERAVLPQLEPDVRRIRVLVVDDNAGFRESLLSLLDAGNLTVIGEAESGSRALDLVAELQPDVVLMDVRMPEMDGIEATRLLKERYPSLGVVALSGHEDQAIVREMLVAGASGYVLKDSDGEDILNAILQAAHGGGVLSPEVTPWVIEELTEALDRERRRTVELEDAHGALVERSTRRHEQLARLSHELRTPVTVILGMAQILQGDRAPEEQREEILARLVQRAEGLTALLERFELASDAALTERVDVAELARSVVELAPDRVRVSAEEGLPSASLNPTVARRILVELVENALRFSPEHSPVDVRVEAGAEGIEVRVTDRGAGIDREIRDRIFAPLEQGESLNARIHQGVGLGLSVARTAARAADGDVVLDHTGTEGSTFCWRVGSSA